VFGDSAKATGIPSDIFRFFLISRRPETSDTDFEWKGLIDANNNDLLKNLGNYCNRVLVFVRSGEYSSTLRSILTLNLDKQEIQLNSTRLHKILQ
jgi:methionyl-tRNA synthetase